MSRATENGRRLGKTALDRWGEGAALLSPEQREAFAALEVVRMLLAQDEQHASPQVRRLQEVARAALAEVSS